MSRLYSRSLVAPVLALALLAAHGWAQAAGESPYWTTAASAGVARQEIYPEVLNGKIYVAGGLLSPNTGYTAHFEAYDPAADAWTRLQTLPEARHHIALSAVNGLLYGIGGFTGGFPHWRAQPTMFVYNPATNTWANGIDLKVARAEGVSAVVDDKLYLIGGRVRATDEARHFNDHVDSVRNEVFDPVTGAWSRRADAPTARNSAAAAVVDGKVYVVGGRRFLKNADGSARQVNVPTLEVYDPKRDRWENRAPMPQAQGGLAATALDGKLYVFGGEQWVPEQKVFADNWVYDPETDAWEALPSLPTPRHGLGAAAVGKRIFVFGGGTQTGGNAATATNEVLVLGD
ncbi:MAG TPA: kelch repeat-containing protein [Noviherbaspirillum sp.]|nr:kelch repeat-containing protein [Noviherbaspirillum sp.]